MNAHSPITIDDTVTADGIELTAGATASAGDDLTINRSLSSTGGSIVLSAGDNLLQNANVTSNGGAVTAVSQTGNISMALGTTTSTGGGSVGYTASAGDIALTSLNAGSGAIGLNAGGDIGSTAGFAGPNLIGGTAVIVGGGNANLSSQVGSLSVQVKGKYTITDSATGGVVTNVPAPAVVNQVVTNSVVASTQVAAAQLTTAGNSQKSSDEKAKDEEAKKKQQAAQTTSTGVKTDDKPKNYCN